ncbi:MAG: hypothetical protein JNK53_02715 [Phycisphaerae bacterium]|nr:hypothetical protein [Phycisphaerae bacterium]
MLATNPLNSSQFAARPHALIASVAATAALASAAYAQDSQPPVAPAASDSTLIAPEAARADGSPAPVGSTSDSNASSSDFGYSVGAGYLHQFNATIDSGASMGVDRFYASFSSRLVKADDFTLTLAMGYEFDWYHWKGTSSLGTNDPFGSVNLFALQLRGSYRLSSEWTVGVAGIFGAAGETSADAGDSIYGGGIASVAWTPSKDVMIGLGLLAVTQLQDDPLFLPIPILHWRFAEEWTLSTIRRPPASPFVGVDVAWEPADSPVDVSVGIAWQQRRFRLGSNTAANLNNGVGEDQSFAAIATVGYDFSPNVRLDLLGGVNFYEKLQVENSAGRQVRDANVDPSAMLGLFLTVRF